MQWIVKTSGAESLIEISNWLVGWSRMVPPRFDKQTYNQDRPRAIGQRRKTNENYMIDYPKFNLLFCDERVDCEMGSRHPRNSSTLAKMPQKSGPEGAIPHDYQVVEILPTPVSKEENINNLIHSTTEYLIHHGREE